MFVAADWSQGLWFLQPLERSLEELLARARLSGPRTHFSFLTGYVLILRLLRSNPTARGCVIILTNLILPAAFYRTRQSACCFQIQNLFRRAALRNFLASRLDGRLARNSVD